MNLEKRVVDCLIGYLCERDGVIETIELLLNLDFSVEEIVKCNFLEEDVLEVKNQMEEEGIL